MTHSVYRQRIYKSYLSNRPRDVAPETVQGLTQRAPTLRKIIANHFPDDHDATILDLGCGHGAFVWFLREAGYRNVIGVDVSAEQADAANRLGIEGVRQGDIMEALRAEPDTSNDVIISFDVIEHFTKEEIIVFVDEVFRVLKPGGRWIIHTPNGGSPFAGRIRYGDFTHEQAFTRESITQILKSSGFVDVICEEDIPVPHGLKSAIRWTLWKVIRSALRFYLAVETGAGEAECIFSQNFLTIAVK